MRTICLKNKPDFPFSYTCMWKVIDKGKHTETVQVTEDSIEIEKHEDFLDQVVFIKNTLCEERCEEITREEFDEFYIKTVERINKTMAL